MQEAAEDESKAGGGGRHRSLLLSLLWQGVGIPQVGHMASKCQRPGSRGVLPEKGRSPPTTRRWSRHEGLSLGWDIAQKSDSQEGSSGLWFSQAQPATAAIRVCD